MSRSTLVQPARPPLLPTAVGRPPRQHFGHPWPRSLRRYGVLWTSVIYVALVAISALFAPWLAPHDPRLSDVSLRFVGPLGLGPDFLLGTDHVGRDVFSRLLYGGRISIGVTLVAVCSSALVGSIAGIVSGYFGGWLDDAIGWFVEVQLAFPFILLAIAILAVLGSGLTNLVLALAISGWVVYARVLRARALELRSAEFVLATRALGASTARVVIRHLVPNCMAPFLVVVSFEVGRMVIGEAALSFLGLGAGGDIASWGGMLSDGRNYLETAWWVTTIPGLAIMSLVLAVNLTGDQLRDILDPRLSRGS